MCRQDGRRWFSALLGDLSKCRTNSQRKSQLRIFIWHLHWMIYTNSTTNYMNIDTQKSVHFAVPRTETRLENASDLLMKYRSYEEHCRPCTRLSGVNGWKKKTKKKKKKQQHWTVPIGYSLFADQRSVPSFGPGFFCLNSGLRKVNSVLSLCTYFRDNAVTGDIPLISLVLKSMVPP